MGKIQLKLSMLNRFGVLVRISEMVARRGYNISSIEAHETDDPSVTEMTLVVYGDDDTRDQIKRQLSKLHDILSID